MGSVQTEQLYTAALKLVALLESLSENPLPTAEPLDLACLLLCRFCHLGSRPGLTEPAAFAPCPQGTCSPGWGTPCC